MKRVLICGDNLALLTVRAEVLRTASFHVDIQLGLSEFQGVTQANAPDIIVLCTSMTLNDRALAKALIEERLPTIPVVTLLRGNETAEGSGHFLRTVKGPGWLIKLITELTRG